MEFTDDAIREVARSAAVANRNIENIGARRLHAVMERIMDDISFDASDLNGQKIVVDAARVPPLSPPLAFPSLPFASHRVFPRVALRPQYLHR